MKKYIQVLAVVPLTWSLACFAAERIINGLGFTDVTLPAGESVHKDGPGDAILNIKGGISVWKNGPGKLYLIGLNDYSVVNLTFKDGDGDIVWVPVDPDKFSAGPIISGTNNGAGKIRQGSWSEIIELRPRK
jgi:hypothetical protein